jgi:subtilisin family serine protease
MKALILADIDNCDIINLSLGGGPADESVEEAILDARGNGMLVVVAAGNNNRKPVSYPAAYPGVIGVSALGWLAPFQPDLPATPTFSGRQPRPLPQMNLSPGFQMSGQVSWPPRPALA